MHNYLLVLILLLGSTLCNREDWLFLDRYIFFFQLPFLPELSSWTGDYGMIGSAFRSKQMGLRNQENITDEDIEAFKYSASQKNPSLRHNFCGEILIVVKQNDHFWKEKTRSQGPKGTARALPESRTDSSTA